jgi:hypothetical protein
MVGVERTLVKEVNTFAETAPVESVGDDVVVDRRFRELLGELDPAVRPERRDHFRSAASDSTGFH